MFSQHFHEVQITEIRVQIDSEIHTYLGIFMVYVILECEIK